MIHKKVSYYGKVIALLAGDLARLYPIFAIFLVASLLDLAGLGLVASFIQAVLAPESSFLFSIFGALDSSTRTSDFNILALSGVALIFFYLFKTVFGLYVNKTMVSFAQLRQRKLSNLLTEKLLTTNPLKAEKQTSAYYIQNVQILTDSFAKQVLIPIFRIASDGLIVMVLLGFLFAHSVSAFLLMLSLVGILAYSYDRFFGRAQQRYGGISNNASQGVVQSVGEIFVGLTEIKLFRKKEFFMQRVRQHTAVFSEATAKGLTIAMAPKYAIELVLMLYVVGVYLVLSYVEESQSNILTTFGVYAFAAVRIVPLGNSLLNSVSELRLRADTVNRLYSNVMLNPDYGLCSESEVILETPDLEPFEVLEFSDVRFGYPSEELILDGANFKIRAGELVALIGESGSGKSTILSLIMGFVQPAFGKIFLNSNANFRRDYFDQNCSFSPQTPFCISGTIYENVTLEHFDANKSSEVVDCLLRSGFIDHPDYSILNKEVDSGGRNLSGGQRQRLALSRALFFDRSILLLDEMTSSLDPLMARRIFATIRHMKGDKTIVVSTHSLDQLDGFDRVLEVKDRKVVQLR